MQKKAIALAIAGLVSAGAYAQSNVQIYGVVDYGYSYRFDKADGAVGGDSNSRFDSGMSAGNRLGFKGVEDIGNGMKAVFVLERGFDLDDGEDKGGFNRQAYVGLAGDWGTLAGGRIYTPHYNLWTAIDPFGGTTVARYHNVKRDITTSTMTIVDPNFSSVVAAEAFDPIRVDNALAYISPNWGGFSFVLAYSNNVFGDDVAKRSDEITSAGTVALSNNNSVAAIAANYSNGPLMVGASYHTISTKALSAYDGLDEIQNFTLGGTYDFGAAKVAFAWGWDNASFKRFKDIEQNNFLLGVTVPFGKHAVKASVNYSRGSDSYDDAYQVGLGYTYNFSKRTNFYAAYAFIDNDARAAGDPPWFVGRSAVTGDASNSGGQYQQAFQIGIKHAF